MEQKAELAPGVKRWLAERAKVAMGERSTEAPSVTSAPSTHRSTPHARLRRMKSKLEKEYIETHLYWESKGLIDSAWRNFPPPDGGDCYKPQ
jgi:hypothetical protein